MAASSGSSKRFLVCKTFVYAVLRATLDSTDGWCGAGMPTLPPVEEVVSDSQEGSQGSSTVMTTAPPYKRHGLFHVVLQALQENHLDGDVDVDFLGENRMNSSRSTFWQVFWKTRRIVPSAAVLQTTIFLGKVAIGVGRIVRYEGLNGAMKETVVRP